MYCLDQFKLGKCSKEWHRIVNTRMSLYRLMGSKYDEIHALAQENFAITNNLYGGDDN